MTDINKTEVNIKITVRASLYTHTRPEPSMFDLSTKRITRMYRNEMEWNARQSSHSDGKFFAYLTPRDSLRFGADESDVPRAPIQGSFAVRVVEREHTFCTQTHYAHQRVHHISLSTSHFVTHTHHRLHLIGHVYYRSRFDLGWYYFCMRAFGIPYLYTI